jgi:hypothetical protein
LTERVQGFENVAKAYGGTRSDTDFISLRQAANKLGKTADVLDKSIARFKL